MEPINVNLSCDIQQPVKVRYLDGYFFSKDSAGHRINVDVFDNGVPVSVGGSVSAEVVRSDGETVPVTGAVSENRAYVILPQAAYAVVGAVQITIKVTEGTTIVTIACFVAYVHESDTEIIVDPGTIIPSIQALISQIETAVASIPADYSSLWTSLAPAFSTSTAYAVGQYVTNSGVLYRFTTAHPAGTWNSAHVTAVNLGAEVYNLKSAISTYAQNSNGQLADVIALSGEHNNGTSNGVTFAWSEDGKTCHASGTSFANTNGINNIWVQNTIFPPALLNRKPLFYVESTNPEHLYGQVYWYIGGSIQPERIDLKNGFTEVEIPSTAGGFALRIIADKGGIAYNDDISIRLVLGDSCYIPSMGKIIIDMKAAIENTLAAFGECHLGTGIFSVSGIEMPEGSVLYGCGDKTEIRLQGTSAGSAIKMTSRCTVRDLMITGSREDITLNTTVGNRHGILWQGNYANEYGEGSADRKENQPSNGTIYNVSIKRFTGGGITCDNTGPAVNHGLNVTNVKIENCNAGINVAYYSEFHRFTNVMAYLCQYACVNNGGNNVFVNCGFSNSKVGIITKMVDGSTIIDRTTGNPKTRPTTNNTHGSAIGCVFNHMDRDDVTLGTGDAVHLEATDNGFFFDSCQFFYGRIYLENSKAISFANCLIGPNKNDQGTSVGYAINLKNTDSTNRKTFFNGCIFSRQPVFTIENTGSGTVAPIINASYTHGGSVVTAG